MRKGMLVLAAAGLFGFGSSFVYADGIASWGPDQFKSKRPIYYWQGGNIDRFVYTTEKADWDHQEYSYEAAKYWAGQAERSRHHTVSYYVDVGDLHYRMGNKAKALTYYQLARTVKRKNVEDHVELGHAFLYAQEPGLADYYFTEAMRYARSRYDWMMISESFASVGNKHMAAIAQNRGMTLR